ncbi:hypothetical protein DPMN_083529 [Dreissena polymorpha]|uniref:Uncharacterized protein n=1 Tax=Dreissena polymorpha TaxID=45954 RepID=A0A9D4BB67_DREPO|nr:hypothetical protein DPMN_083529 [Dreissena polymorpha]
MTPENLLQYCKLHEGFKRQNLKEEITMYRQENEKTKNSPIRHFIDYEQAFYNVYRKFYTRLLRHYGVPEKITNIIRNVLRYDLQDRSRNTTYRSFESENRIEERLLSLTFPVPANDRLSHEYHDGGKAKRKRMDN